MTNEEKFIREKMGHSSPFSVPEGYFEELTPRLMQKLPAVGAGSMPQQKPAILHRLRPLLYAAACLLVAVLSVAVYLSDDKATGDGQTAVAKATEVSADAYFEEAADYAMVDNHDIYACLMND